MTARRVLFVTSSYPFSDDDFHARFVHDMARALVRDGDRVRVLTPATPGGAPSQVFDGVEVERFRYSGLTRFPSTGRDGLFENVRREPRAALSLGPLFLSMAAGARRRIQQLRPDLVISHWLVPGGLAVARAGARRAVHIAHSSDVHLLARLPGGRTIARAVRASGPVLATSHFLADKLRASRLVDDPIVWTLGVDVPPEPSPHRPSTGPLQVAFLGRLIEGKGLRELIEAIGRTNAQLSIAGDGPLRTELTDVVQRGGLSDRVHFVGPLTGPAKQAFLASHDLLAHVPSRLTGFTDNLPVACVEALAAGTPVLATPVGGLPELLADGAGLVVSPDQVGPAFEKLDRAALSPLAAAARRSAGARSWPHALAALQKIVASAAPSGLEPDSATR